jgi:H+/Cl- antiporter ClcA
VLCGIVAYILLRLIAYSQEMFDFLRDRLGVPKEVTPALGGLLVGSIALKYPGVLYWGFENVDEILHSRTSPTAPGPRLLLQLVFAKIIATSLCKGSGLVGGIYAPSLFLGAALGSAYGAIAGGLIDFMIPGPSEVAAPQAYALVGMAAMLAGVCQVPMTSVLLLFELTQDYRIMLPLSGAVGLSAWVASTAMKKEENPKKAKNPSSPRGRKRGGSGPGGVIAAEAYAGAKGGAGKPYRKGRSSVGDQGLELIQLPTGEVFTEEELMDDIKVSQAMMTKMVTVSVRRAVVLFFIWSFMGSRNG